MNQQMMEKLKDKFMVEKHISLKKHKHCQSQKVKKWGITIMIGHTIKAIFKRITIISKIILKANNLCRKKIVHLNNNLCHLIS